MACVNWEKSGSPCKFGIPSVRTWGFSSDRPRDCWDWSCYHWRTWSPQRPWLEGSLLWEREFHSFLHCLFHLPPPTMVWSKFNWVCISRICRVISSHEIQPAIMPRKFSNLCVLQLVNGHEHILTWVTDWLHRNQGVFTCQWHLR